MAVVVEVRNPDDLNTTYDQIEIERNTANSESGMANIATVDIDTTSSSDLSMGYTGYVDSAGTIGTHYYRFRYKNSGSGAVSSYSDIFAAGGSILQTRFRRLMRDVNSNNYYFTSDDLDFYEQSAVLRLWPTTWFETYSSSFFTPDNSTKIFAFPVGCTRVDHIEIVDSAGNFVSEKLGYKVRGRYLIFDEAPITSVTYRVWFDKMFTKLSEVPPLWDEHLLNCMRLLAYESMEGDRNKFYKYNSIAKPEGGNLPSLDRIITRIETQIRLRENQIRRTRRPTSLKLV